MNPYVYLISAALVLPSVILVVRQYRGHKKKQVFPLVFIRMAIAGLIAIAFFQPGFSCSQLLRQKHRTVILVDNSQSMTLFNDNDTLLSMLKRIDSLLIHNDSIQKSAVFFGDSLIHKKDMREGFFTHKKSDLPNILQERQLAEAERILLVTDGNWTNSRISTDQYLSKECYYLTLPPLHLKPFIKIESVDTDIIKRGTELVTAKFVLSGFTPQPLKLNIQTTMDTKQAHRQTMTVESGTIHDTLSLTIPNSVPGKHLFRVHAQNQDSLESMAQVVVQAIPEKLAIYVHAPKPRLDTRFLTLTIQKDSLWRIERKPQNNSLDALIIMGGDNAASSLRRFLKPHGVLVFFGTKENRSESKTVSQKYRLFPEYRLHSAPPFIVPADNPPLSEILSTVPKNFKSSKRYFPLQSENAKSTAFLLQEGRWRNKVSFFIAAEDLWKWDFLPFGLRNKDSYHMPFTENFLVLLKEAVIEGISREFLAYPRTLPLYSEKPIDLAIDVPGISVNKNVQELQCTVISENADTVFDTSLSIARNWTLRIPPLEQGRYYYIAHLKTREGSYTRKDSIQVLPNISEYEITTQNYVLLNQIAAPIDIDDTEQWKSLNQVERSPDMFVDKKITFSQSIPLLGAILFLFTLEWALRKRFKID